MFQPVVMIATRGDQISNMQRETGSLPPGKFSQLTGNRRVALGIRDDRKRERRLLVDSRAE